MILKEFYDWYNEMPIGTCFTAHDYPNYIDVHVKRSIMDRLKANNYITHAAGHTHPMVYQKLKDYNVLRK